MKSPCDRGDSLFLLKAVQTTGMPQMLRSATFETAMWHYPDHMWWFPLFSQKASVQGHTNAKACGSCGSKPTVVQVAWFFWRKPNLLEQKDESLSSRHGDLILSLRSQKGLLSPHPELQVSGHRASSNCRRGPVWEIIFKAMQSASKRRLPSKSQLLWCEPFSLWKFIVSLTCMDDGLPSWKFRALQQSLHCGLDDLDGALSYYNLSMGLAANCSTSTPRCSAHCCNSPDLKAPSAPRRMEVARP